jgi:hypothetical protein
MAARCPNGHDIPESNTFCGVCGLPADTSPVEEIRCINDHVIPDGNTYCGACGSTAKPIEDSSTVCPNGHPVQPEMAFCEECGSALVAPQTGEERVEPSPSGVGVGKHGALPDADAAADSSHSMKLVGVLGGVLILVVLGILLINANSAKKSAVANASSPSPSVSLTRHEICVNQMTQLLYNVTRKIDELSLNGYSDPFYMQSIQLNAQFQADVVISGQANAQSKLDQAIAHWCAQSNDPRRNRVDDYGDPS